MFLELEQESILIGRKPSGFTQHYYTEWDDGLGREKITLFLLVSISSTQVPGAEIGKEAFQLLQDHFLDDLKGDPYDRFENALREVNLMVNEKEAELDLHFIPNMHVVCGVIQEDMLFLSQRGDAHGYLVRKRHVSSITEGLCDEKNKEDLFQNIASGDLDVGDAVVLVTGQLVQHVAPSDLSKIFSEQALGEATKELRDLLHSDMEDQIALLAFEVLEKNEHIEPIVEEISDDEVVEKPSTVAVERDWNKHLKIFRSWLTHEERWAFLSRLPAMPALPSAKKMGGTNLLKGIVGLVVVIVGGLILLQVTSGNKKAMADVEAKLLLAEENILQAETKGPFDKATASELLSEAETLTIEVMATDLLGSRASTVLDEIAIQRDFLDNVVRIDEELEMLVDFSDLLGSAEIQGVLPYNDKHLVYTETEAYEVLIDEAQSPNVLDPDEEVIAGSFFADRNRVILLSKSGKLMEYSDGNSQFADTADVDWQQGVDLASYSNKVYFLDALQSQIWRYQRGTTGYGSAQAYTDPEEVDLNEAVSLAIDGNIWILHSDGSITKLLSGEPVVFDINKEPLTSFEGATQIYTELEVNQLYVLDPLRSRILIYTKSQNTENITYDSQYVFEGLKGTMQDMYIDKSRDVIVFTTDEALYELSFN